MSAIFLTSVHAPTELVAPIKKKPRSASSASKAAGGESAVLAVDCTRIVVASDGSQRFVCKYPGCSREYASRDAVRKHCRLRHLQWLRGLDRTATTDVEVVHQPEAFRGHHPIPSVANDPGCAPHYDTPPLPPPPPLAFASAAPSEAAPAQPRQPPVAQAVVALQDQMTLLPGGFAPCSLSPGGFAPCSPAMGPFAITSPLASPAFGPQSPAVLARMPSLLPVLSPILLPPLSGSGSHEMAYLPPLDDLPTYAFSSATTAAPASAAFAPSGLGIHTNGSWSYVKGVGARTFDLLKTGLSPRPAPAAASAVGHSMSGQQPGMLLKPVAVHA